MARPRSHVSSALHLSEAGFSVVVLEAGEIGSGASGRSGGQVIPGLKYDPDGMRKLFGDEGGTAAAHAFGSTAERVFRLIDRHGIACRAVNAGWVQPAHSRAALSVALDRWRQWQRLGADVTPLSKSEVADLLGTDAYRGGWIDRRGGGIQPLSYTRGLARACLQQGVAIGVHTRAERIARDGSQWRVSTSRGTSVHADRVVVCTNGYSGGLWPGLDRSIIAANSFQVATAPLAEPEHGRIMKGGIVASDTRKLLAYWRRDEDGRLLLGGRGPFADPESPKDFGHLERKLATMYPALARQPIQFRWFGRIAATPDSLPHIHQPAPGVLALIGCQGRGIGLQTALGQWLADTLPPARRTPCRCPSRQSARSRRCKPGAS